MGAALPVPAAEGGTWPDAPTGALLWGVSDPYTGPSPATAALEMGHPVQIDVGRAGS
jgi:hypothetical protein